ncbi:MAG: hypothetical protein KatS3mg023_2522 [Armatimonadota bacterium]|nr:MAG: hypothetical protein KatS3mg023_2522 [Armatimonadota bacterium]
MTPLVNAAGTAGVITNVSAQVISHNLYDVFGVLRYQQGNAETPWRWVWIQASEEGLRMALHGQIYLPERMLIPLFSNGYDSRKDCPFSQGGPYPRSMCDQCVKGCIADANRLREQCERKQDIFCDSARVICLLLPGPLFKVFCFTTGMLCSHDDTCNARYSGMVSWCMGCFDTCVRNSR